MRYFLENKELKVELDRRGAELKSVLSKANYREYMWYGNGKYWGRSSPVLFPFVGRLRDNCYFWKGKRYPMNQHGFARDMDFEPLSQTETELRFLLRSDVETLEKFPFDFELEISYTLEGRTLRVGWTVRNTGTETMYFSIGAHPAFLCPIHGEDSKAGYRLVFPGLTELRHYGNTPDTGLAMYEDLALPLTDGAAVITEEFFDRATYIAEGNQTGEVRLEDPDGRPIVSVVFDAPIFGLWSPERKNAPFLCIEPWYGRCDAVDFEGELADRAFTNALAPGAAFDAGYSMTFGRV